MAYEIRLCRCDELDLLREFIRKYWSEDHILVHEKKVLDFQHKCGDFYNFVIAYHVDTFSFHGVLGFVSPSFYSRGFVEVNDDVWLALWKVEKSLSKLNSLGVDLLDFIMKRYSPRSISAIGINTQVELLYKLLGFKLGVMRQYFILNSKLTETSIAKIGRPLERKPLSSSVRSEIIIEEIGDGLEQLSMKLEHKCITKNLEYFINRYRKHPVYGYQFFLIRHVHETYGFFVARKIECNGSACMRITDIQLFEELDYGFKETTSNFLQKQNCEYADLMVFGDIGFDPSNIGFTENSDDNFVPHLFEPFVTERREVKVAYRSQEAYSCFKGDSDLDRPNMIERIGKWVS